MKPGAASHDLLVAAAAALQGRIQEDAAQQDRERRLTDRTVTALRDSGLLRLTVPRSLGGHEAGLRTLLDVSTELGRGCTSTGWVTGIVNTGNFLAALLPHEVRTEVWGTDPDACSLGVLAPSARVEPADGGVRVTGRWGYSSGSQIASWAMVGIPPYAGAEHPGPALVLIPMSELTVEDTWHVMGMRATASNTVVAQEVLVPARRILPLVPLMSGALVDASPGEPLYQSSLPGILILSLCGPQLGAARTALDYVRAEAPKRAITTTNYASQSASVAIQADVAAAANKIDTADLLLHRMADVLDDHAGRGMALDLDLKTRNRVDGAKASQLLKEALDLLASAHGAASFADSSPLQRIFRDINVASRHTGTALNIPLEVHGKALLGLDPYETTSML
jgi:3-hydroxy-9,10-secoandrosta-1,3,5(10)-triene-9,17-dione monooxygenase